MLELLLNRLNDGSEDVRERAFREACDLPAESLVELARLEQQRYRQARHRAVLETIVFAVMSFAILGVLEHYIKAIGHMGGALGGITIGFYTARLPKQGRRCIVQIFEQTENPHFVGPALEVLGQLRYERDQGMVTSARNAIKRLLPHLSSGEAHQLTGSQRQTLLSLLQKPLKDVEMTLTVLKALEQVGDKSAIPVVLRLREWPWNPDTGEVKRKTINQIRLAARECLPYLKINAERLEQADLLLRASDALSTASPEVLLRPASGSAAASIPTEDLLRPASDERREPRSVSTTPVSQIEEEVSIKT